MASTEELYRYHAGNAAEVAAAIKQARRLANLAIREGDERIVGLMTRQYALLLAGLIECRLKQLIHEPPVPATVRLSVQNAGSQAEQWKSAIDNGFIEHFKPPRGKPDRMAFTDRTRWRALTELVDKELSPVASLRNSLAHGQWRYLLNNAETGTSPDLMRAVALETILSLTQKEALLKKLCLAVNDLLVSGPTFTRDFDLHYRDVEAAQQRLRDLDWEGHVQEMRERHERGRERRDNRGPGETVGRRLDHGLDRLRRTLHR